VKVFQLLYTHPTIKPPKVGPIFAGFTILWDNHVRDVAFKEDACKVRFNKLPVVFSPMRSFALNLLNLNGIEKNIIALNGMVQRGET